MLSPEQIAHYNDNGYVVLRGLLTPEEAAYYRAETHALADRLARIRNIDATWLRKPGEDESKKTVILHSHDVQFHSAAFSRLIVDERLTGAVADLIGPNVQLHHTKMFIKPPEKGSPFPLHQDAPFFPHERHTMMAAIIHFDDAPLEKGCVCVVPGSHKLGLLPHLADGPWHLPIDKYPLESATPIPAKAGDVLLFSYLTIHGSGINASNEARTTLLVQMRDPEDAPLYHIHESDGQGMMLHGIDPSCRTTKPLSDSAPEAVGMGGAMAAPMGGAMGGGMG